jgi:hypothetical protein
METFRIRPALALVAIAIWLAPARSEGQSPAVAAPPQCSYERCALGIAPRLTALDVVRGSNQERVASLAFLWPRGVAAPFAGDSASLSHAHTAVRLRRVGAVMTDVAIALGGAGIARFSSHSAGSARNLLIASTALLGASVPIHFAADGELSRAVWLFNRRFAH